MVYFPAELYRKKNAVYVGKINSAYIDGGFLFYAHLYFLGKSIGCFSLLFITIITDCLIAHTV